MRRAILVSMLCSGCGAPSGADDDAATPPAADEEPKGEPEQQAPRSLYVADAAALPACTADGEGWLVYVKSDAKFKACLSGAWADVEAPAPAGEDIEAQWLCGLTGDLDSVADTETKGARALISKLSSGNYLFSCIDRFSDAGFTYADTSGDTILWSAGSAGVGEGAIMCSGFYARATFTIADGSVSWQTLAGDPAVAASCSKTK